jgi:predicted acylesterase/phospholipase RssA
MFPLRIYLSGGGICATAHVGALQELSKHIPLKAIKEWMGVSAGSLIAMCLCIGFTLDELYEFSVRFDFSHIQDPDGIPGWILHFGMDTGERLQRLVNACLHVKGLSSEITFQEIYQKYGLSLRVLATDLNQATGKCFSPTDTPHYPVSYAVRASMTYPYYFQPFVCPITGHSYVDGGVTSNYPLYLIPKEEHSRTWSILLRLTMETAEHLEDLSSDHRLIRPLSIALTEKTNIETTLYDVECIKIPLNGVSVLDFSLSEEIKKELVRKGSIAVKEFMKGRSRPVRRHSF